MTKVRVKREEILQILFDIKYMGPYVPYYFEVEGEVVSEEQCNCEDLQWPHQHTGPSFPFKPTKKQYTSIGDTLYELPADQAVNEPTEKLIKLEKVGQRPHRTLSSMVAELQVVLNEFIERENKRQGW